MKTVNVFLGYFKQGDDLRQFLEEGTSPEESLMMHRELLLESINRLERILDMIRGEDVEINADTHHIGITCEDEVADQIVRAGIGHIWEE